MVVLRFESKSNVLRGNAICQDIMSGLDIEGLLHFSERRDKEMDEDEAWEYKYAKVPQLDSQHNQE